MAETEPGGVRTPQFDVVLRGYDRTQVDTFLADRLGPDATAPHPSAPGRIDLPGIHSVPVFDMVLRGYNPRRVDALTRRITATVAGSAATPVTRTEAEGATFRTALRGYDQRQVRTWIADTLPRLPE